MSLPPLDAAAEARRIAMLAEWEAQDACAARIVAAFPDRPALVVEVAQSDRTGRFYSRIGKASRLSGPFVVADTMAEVEERTIAKLRAE